MKTMTFVLALAAATPAPAQQQQQMKPPTPEEMKGRATNTHGGVKKYDMVLRWVDRDTYVSEIVFYLPGGPLKMVESTHRRAK